MVHIIMQKLTFEKAITGDLSVLDEATDYNAAQACVRKTPDLENNIVHLAAQYGHLDLLKAAINRFPELLLQKNKNGDTPLHMAAQWEGPKEIIKTLISLLKNSSSSTDDENNNNNNIPVNGFLMEINKQGNTPFHVALRSNNMEAAQELFEYIKNDYPQILVTRNNFGDVPLHLYVKYCAEGISILSNLDLSNNIMVHIIMQKLTFEKAIKGDLNCLDDATDYNAAQACVRKTPDLENNIVHIAVQYGHLDLLKAAINRFPELLLQKNKNGDTPLHMAAQWEGPKEIIKTLISLLKNSSSSC